LLLFEFADQSVDMDSAATVPRKADGPLSGEKLQLFLPKGVVVSVWPAAAALLFDK